MIPQSFQAHRAARQAQEWRADQEPRTLRTGDRAEPRIAPVDERAITTQVRLHESQVRRTDLATDFSLALEGLAALNRITQRFPVAVAGDHRSELRAVKHHVRRLAPIIATLRNQL